MSDVCSALPCLLVANYFTSAFRLSLEFPGVLAAKALGKVARPSREISVFLQSFPLHLVDYVAGRLWSTPQSELKAFSQSYLFRCSCALGQRCDFCYFSNTKSCQLFLHRLMKPRGVIAFQRAFFPLDFQRALISWEEKKGALRGFHLYFFYKFKQICSKSPLPTDLASAFWTFPACVRSIDAWEYIGSFTSRESPLKWREIKTWEQGCQSSFRPLFLKIALLYLPFLS